MAISYAKRERLAEEFAQAINRASVENDSNTPDFILGRYLVACLEAYGVAVIERDEWYGERMRPGRAADTTSEGAK